MVNSALLTTTSSRSNARLWTGRALTTVAGAFAILDGGMKLAKAPQVVEATAQLGFPPESIPLIGVLLLACTAIYLVPRTSVLGAILLTGYLGGATAAGIRIERPLFEIIFPVMFAVLVWAGVFLREDRLRALLPMRDER